MGSVRGGGVGWGTLKFRTWVSRKVWALGVGSRYIEPNILKVLWLRIKAFKSKHMQASCILGCETAPARSVSKFPGVRWGLHQYVWVLVRLLRFCSLCCQIWCGTV